MKTKPTQTQPVMQSTSNQVVKTLDGKIFNLNPDRRIKHTAIRILRTLKPQIGFMYADYRKNGRRYKACYLGMIPSQINQLAEQLNDLYQYNAIPARAYSYEDGSGFVCLCVRVGYKKKC